MGIDSDIGGRRTKHKDGVVIGTWEVGHGGVLCCFVETVDYESFALDELCSSLLRIGRVR